RKRQRSGCAGNCDLVILQRLSQYLQRLNVELGQLIEEQHTTVRQADLARTGNGSTTNQANVTRGVVWRPKRTLSYQRRFRRQQATVAVNPRNLERFLQAHGGQDARHTSGQECLTGSWRTTHDEVMGS